MKGLNQVRLVGAVLAGSSSYAHANGVEQAIMNGTIKLDANTRYEYVQQDNGLKDANALTLRTRLTYQTQKVYGFTAVLEFEDSRNLFGVDKYNNAIGKNTEYSVIADPNTTELDQAYLHYQHDWGSAKIGRQVIALDNQRFVGHVGWRQDRQVFDAARLQASLWGSVDVEYIYINERERIFAQVRDINSNDNLLHLSWASSLGTLVAYAYLLDNQEVDNDQLNSYGVRFAGKTGIGAQSINYQLEYAHQTNDLTDTNSHYYHIEVGSSIKGVGLLVGYEVLGSDNGESAFQTPLATLHKFNGWADQFLVTPADGLKDLYLSVSSKTKYGNFSATYHSFTADNSSATDSYGSEIDVAYTKKFNQHYRAGVKYAAYSADQYSVDTDKWWLWFGASF